MTILRHINQQRHLFVTLALLLVGWLLLAPTQIGGKTAYVIINGNSMQPSMQRGDLAILRATGDYQVGDVVTYQHDKLGAVIHRIVAQQSDRFVMQGDNNFWLDSYQPNSDEVLGELWLTVPRAGSILSGFRTAAGAALFAGAIGVLLLWPLLWSEDAIRPAVAQMAKHMAEVSKVLPDLPLILTHNGKAVAKAEGISTDVATLYARFARSAWRGKRKTMTGAWLRLQSQRVLLYSLPLAGDMLLLVEWDGQMALKSLRSQVLKAARLMSTASSQERGDATRATD